MGTPQWSFYVHCPQASETYLLGETNDGSMWVSRSFENVCSGDFPPTFPEELHKVFGDFPRTFAQRADKLGEELNNLQHTLDDDTASSQDTQSESASGLTSDPVPNCPEDATCRETPEGRFITWNAGLSPEVTNGLTERQSEELRTLDSKESLTGREMDRLNALRSDVPPRAHAPGMPLVQKVTPTDAPDATRLLPARPSLTERQMDELFGSTGNGGMRKTTFLEGVVEIILFLAVLLVFYYFCFSYCLVFDDHSTPEVVVVNPNPTQPRSPRPPPRAPTMNVNNFGSAVPLVQSAFINDVVPACEVHPEQMMSAFQEGPVEHVNVDVSEVPVAPISPRLVELLEESLVESPVTSPRVQIEEEPEFNIVDDKTIAI